jgi:hypothetical protein
MLLLIKFMHLLNAILNHPLVCRKDARTIYNYRLLRLLYKQQNLCEKSLEKRRRRTMNIRQRIEHLPHQERAFTIGKVEYIHNQWILFDDHDEPTALKDLSNESFEILIDANWITFNELDNGMAFGPQKTYTIKEGDTFRIQKPLAFVYQEWLKELTDETLTRFVTTLNSLHYSIYDCNFCHNFLFFHVSRKPVSGVNFLLFDNDEQICGIQHHFTRNSTHTDRFEITLSNGTRQLLTNLQH